MNAPSNVRRAFPLNVFGLWLALLAWAVAPALATPQPVEAQADLAGSFNVSQTTLFEARSAADFSKFQVLREATVAPGANGLHITAAGTDPQLLLPPFAAGKQFILQVVIEAPFETPCQMFYQVADRPGFVEAQSQLVPLKKGRNTVYFKVDVSKVIDPVRIDPGASAGEYTIESVVARAVSGPNAGK